MIDWYSRARSSFKSAINSSRDTRGDPSGLFTRSSVAIFYDGRNSGAKILEVALDIARRRIKNWAVGGSRSARQTPLRKLISARRVSQRLPLLPPRAGRPNLVVRVRPSRVRPAPLTGI